MGIKKALYVILRRKGRGLRSLNLSEYYANLPYDLAGSRAKNRFRNEILWGFKKMLEIYKKDIEFTIVFDYCCDIEIHKTEGFEFYQVKTQNDNGSYTIDKMIRRNTSGDSVLGKLYKLKYDSLSKENDKTQITLVSNAPLSDGKTAYNNREKVDLSSLNSVAVAKIKKNMKEELKLIKEINLKNTSFEKTGIDLIYPEKTLIGETVIFFEDTFNSEPKKVHMLFKILKNEIETKASYELKVHDYKDLLEKKGINKVFLDGFLKNYIEKADIAVEKAKVFIDQLHANSFKKRYRLNSALTQVIIQLCNNNKSVQKIEIQIQKYIKDNVEDIPEDDLETIELISQEMAKIKPIEVSNEEIQALVILVMKKFEEGVYLI